MRIKTLKKPVRRRPQRKMTLGRVPRPRYRSKPGHLLSYRRKFWLESWSPTSVNVSGFWRRYNQSFTNLPNFAELSALFEHYRINKIKLTFMPAYDSFAGNDNSDTGLPGITFNTGTYVHILNDPQSTQDPLGVYGSTTLNRFMELGKVKTIVGIRPFSIYYTPAIVVGSIASQFVSPRWLPMSANNQTHFGPQVYMQLPNFSGAAGSTWMQTWDVYVTMYLQVKGMV